MKAAFKYLICFFLFLSTSVFGQQSFIDSLLKTIDVKTSDTIQMITLNKVAREYCNEGDYDNSFYYANKVLVIGYKMLPKATDPILKRAIRSNIALSYNTIGIMHDDKGEYTQALQSYNKSLEIRKELHDLAGEAGSLNNIGLIHEQLGNYPEAIKCHFASLKVSESLSDFQSIASSYSNLGNIYSDQGDYVQALKWHNESLRIRTEQKMEGDMARSFNNIGLVYFQKGDFDQALKYHFLSLEKKLKLNQKLSATISYNNIGVTYFEKSKVVKIESERMELYELALKNYVEAYRVQEAAGENSSFANLCNNIGNVYIQKGAFSEARKYLDKAKQILLRSGNKKYLRGTFASLMRLDSATGNFKSALDDSKLYVLYRDSLNNEDSHRRTVQTQMTYDFEKKEAIATAEYKKEFESQQLLADEKSRKQQLILLFVVGSLVLVIVFAVFILRSLKTTRKQKMVIEKQKEIVETQKDEVEKQKLLVEEHQKEIIDSIMYAWRIQRSLMPTDKYIDKSIERLKNKL